MSSAAYQVADEPKPGALAHLAVDPLWPFFALMLCGSWMAFPWFILNAIAVGSPTRVKEIGMAIAAVAGLVVIIVFIATAVGLDLLTTNLQVELAYLVRTVWKLGAGYLLYGLQSRTMQIHEYYGGILRNGFPILLVGMLFGGRVLELLPPFLRVVLR